MEYRCDFDDDTIFRNDLLALQFDLHLDYEDEFLPRNLLLMSSFPKNKENNYLLSVVLGKDLYPENDAFVHHLDIVQLLDSQKT